MLTVFQEIFEPYAIDNLMFAINENFKARLDEFYPDDDFPDFAEKTLGNIIRLSFPALTIDPDRFGSPESESGEFVETDYHLSVHMAVADPDPVNTTRILIKYVRAFKSVVRRMGRSEWLRNVPPAPSNPMGLYVDINGQYGQPAKNPNKTNTYIRHIDFDLRLRFQES